MQRFLLFLGQCGYFGRIIFKGIADSSIAEFTHLTFAKLMMKFSQRHACPIVPYSIHQKDQIIPIDYHLLYNQI